MSDTSRAVFMAVLWILVSAAENQKIILAESGQNVNLSCRAPNGGFINVRWSRADLGVEYVLLHRDGHFDPANQHPAFKNRVDLQDRQMKDGDVSLILKNVTINDTGTYECWVFMNETRSLKSICTINLRVDSRTRVLDWQTIGAVCAVMIVIVIVIYVLFWKYKTNITYGLKKIYNFLNGALDKEEEEEETACIAPQRGNSVVTAATDIRINIADSNNVKLYKNMT